MTLAQVIRKMELLLPEIRKTEGGTGSGEKRQEYGFGHIKFEMPNRQTSKSKCQVGR